jgi:glycine cleavage system H protein
MGFLRLEHCEAAAIPLHIVQQLLISHLTRISHDAIQKIGTIGITEYAQKALGDVVFVELPTAGTEVAKHGKLLLSILNLITRLTVQFTAS